MPARRVLLLASFAAAMLLAGGAGLWLGGGHLAGDGEAMAGGKIGAPFRSSDFGRSRVTLVSSPEAGPAMQGQAGDEAQILRHLEAHGFSDITNLRRRGGTFICEATGPRRERVRLVVDTASGEVTGMQVIGFTEPRP